MNPINDIKARNEELRRAKMTPDPINEVNGKID
jgi:hypothetical protein